MGILIDKSAVFEARQAAVQAARPIEPSTVLEFKLEFRLIDSKEGDVLVFPTADKWKVVEQSANYDAIAWPTRMQQLAVFNGKGVWIDLLE